MKIQTKNKIVATLLILMISFVTWSSDCPPPSDPCWDMGNQANWGNWNDITAACEKATEITAACWRGCDCSPE
jgi:hypothetical protein